MDLKYSVCNIWEIDEEQVHGELWSASRKSQVVSQVIQAPLY